MSKRVLILYALVFAILAYVAIRAVWALVWNPPVQQPIAFNHKLHAESGGLSCSDCHTLFETHFASGRPNLETCMECHWEPLGESPEEEKLLEYQDRGEEIPWERLYTAGDNVFYSHRRHVVVAEIECEECHGDFAELESPPHRALRPITMQGCWDCHEQRGVSNDCLACHR